MGEEQEARAAQAYRDAIAGGMDQAQAIQVARQVLAEPQSQGAQEQEARAAQAYRDALAGGIDETQAIQVARQVLAEPRSQEAPSRVYGSSIGEEVAALQGRPSRREDYAPGPPNPYLASALMGGGTGAIVGGPVGALLGAAGGVTGTATDLGLAAVDLNRDGTPGDIPGWIRFPMSMLTGGVVSGPGGRIVNRALNRLAPGAAQLTDDAAAAGVRLRAGDLGDEFSSVRAVEDKLAALGEPGMRRSMAGQADELAEATANLRDDAAPWLAERMKQAMPGTSPSREVAEDLVQRYGERKTISDGLYKLAATEAADDLIPTTSVRQAAERALFETATEGASDDVANLARQVLDMPPEQVTYDVFHIWEKRASSLANAIDGGTSRGRAKLFAQAIKNDIAEWAPTNPSAGRAHRNAVDYFKREIGPFRENATIRRLVDGDMGEADRVIGSVLGGYTGTGRPAATQSLMDLLGTRGREALAYDLLDNAVERGGAFLSNNLSPYQVVRNMNMGTASRPRVGRTVMRAAGRADLEQQADALTRLYKATLRSNAGSSNVPPSTGLRNLPTISNIGTFGGGAALGYGATGGNPIAMMAGGLALTGAERGVRKGVSSVLRSRPFLEYMKGMHSSPYPGLLGAAAGQAANIPAGFTFGSLLGNN